MTKHHRPRCRKAWSAEQRLAHHTRPDPISGCLIWQGPPTAAGYGHIRFHKRSWLAHRWAWTTAHGPIPPGMFLCHRCDEKRCVNPDHLFLGTHAINMADLRAKRIRRHAPPASAFNTDDAAPIRIFYRGLELIGEVVVAPFDPQAWNTGIRKGNAA